jgi:F-type H+-transporting ATPase subunit b
MELFKIDPGLAIWTWISFGILFLLLSEFAFPTLLKNIRLREESIARSVDNAALIEQRLSDIEKEKSEILKQSQAEADEILRRTRADAEVVRQRLIEKAENEACEIIERAKKKMEEERESVIASMRHELADFVCTTSAKIIGRTFTST